MVPVGRHPGKADDPTWEKFAEPNLRPRECPNSGAFCAERRGNAGGVRWQKAPSNQNGIPNITIVAMKKPKKREVPTMQIRISGALFSVALKAARSITAPFREGGQQPALTSIVFSVVALEAFLNEATDIGLEYYSDPAISLFVDFIVDAEKSRASLESKFVLSCWILAGQKFDRGSQPYQDFALLLGLRNDLVHFKATEEVPLHLSAEEIHEKLINKFRSKNILSDELFHAAPWTYLIETKAVAGWACKTASRMVVEFYEKMPREKMPQNMWRHFVATLVCASADIGTIPNRVESWPLSGPDPT
jgi:hypothetical protein